MRQRTLSRQPHTLLAWLVAVLLTVTLGAAQAQAEPVTPDLPTLDVTLVDPDPTHNTIDYLHASKDNKVPTTMTLEDPSGQFSFTDLPGEIKGRGNTTWRMEKKPYQIKFDSGLGVLGMESAKTWVLLANHLDASLMHNKIAYDLAGDVGLPFSPTSRWVDVRINGDYYGNYLLSEKTEVKTNRVQLTHPQGVLVELDLAYGTTEDYYVRTAATNTTVVLKEAVSDVPDKDEEPLPADTQAGWEDMQATLDELDGLLVATNPDWAAISELIDVESFAKFYLVQELAENPDIGISSVYFYKDGPDDKLHAGPVWDFDAAFGISGTWGAPTDAEYVKNAQFIRRGANSWFYHLFRNVEFVQAVNDAWTDVADDEVAALPAAIDAHEAAIAASAANNFARWPDVLGTNGNEPTYAGAVDRFRQWVSERGAHLGRAYGDVPTLRYRSHVANLGWMHKVNSGQISGTTGESRRLEAVALEIANSTTQGTIQANTHVQNIGWSGFKNADLMGTTGLGLRMEAMQLRLTGDLAAKYDISYRTHVSGIGWQSWVMNGQTAGTTGQARQIEAVQVRLLHKSADSVVPKGTATYSAHVQNIGWMAPVTDGATAGTTGRSLRMEALRLKATSTIATGDISYRAHVQNVGWQSWRNSSTYVGTVGSGLRMEAVQIMLTGDLAASYRIRYQTHVHGIGWQPWVYDGATAGTTGQARRIEAIKIELVPR